MKRNTQQQTLDALKVVLLSPRGLLASHIMQKANIPNSTAADLIGKLTVKGYLNKQLGGRRYVYTVTQKAVALLHSYRLFEELYRELI